MRLLQTALWLAVGISPALAQRAPVIVIPGRPDVPVLMNGVDVSWSVIEGEFGLDRPNEVNPTVIYRPFGVVSALGPPYIPPRSFQPGYFPSTGHRPGYGRLEVEPPPNRPVPPPAPTYFRGWSSESAPGPATTYTPVPEMPGLVYGGWGGDWRHRPWHDRGLLGQAAKVHTRRGMAGDSFHTIIGRAAPQFVFIRLVNGAACRGVSCLVIALSSWLSPRC